MLNAVIIIWVVLLVVSAAILMLLLKHKDRKLSKYDMLFRLGYAIIAFGVSGLIYYFLQDNSHTLVVVTRIGLLLLGVLNTVVIYHQKWSVRDSTDYSKDSFWLEMVYMLSCAFTSSIAFLAAPFSLELVPYAENIAINLWDAPLVYMLPFFVWKTIDISGQRPLKEIERPWLFPIEQVNPKDWQWRNLKQVNFELHSSLETEYDLFSWYSKPWIEAPQEMGLGIAFRLCIQLRRENNDYSSIQDMGDEYDGDAQFCWLFYRKQQLTQPKTWFTGKRYFNPFLSITENNIGKSDVIVATRIVGDGSHSTADFYDNPISDDTEKTVFIQR